MKKTGISPTRKENYSEWYQQVIRSADLAENSAVRGCMVIKPWGYQIWENIQKKLDKKFKETGHVNAYFPLFIPLKYLNKEAAHVKGFAKECAVVTHSRLCLDDNNKLVPCSELEEPIIVRPTSETIIGESFSRWIQSYRDLPLKINQWANVVRWEMRPRLFLRTSEFLWQEGHTAHATQEEAVEEAVRMIEIYRDFAENELGIPVIVGEKTESERFPGAISTYTMEAMMQDGKALQFGTSHFLGQNFSKAMNIVFADVDSKQKFAWTTSWGVTTRLIGGLIMSHSDDDGLILPPRMANLNAVIIPVVHDESKRSSVEQYCEKIRLALCDKKWVQDISVSVDNRDIRGGEKRWQWIKKGVNVIIEIGSKEVESEMVTIVYRDNLADKKQVNKNEFIEKFVNSLNDMQQRLLDRAKNLLNLSVRQIEDADSFYEFFRSNDGFVLSYWSEDEEIEKKIKEELKVTPRCYPHEYLDKRGQCPFTKKQNCKLALFAKAY